MKQHVEIQDWTENSTSACPTGHSGINVTFITTDLTPDQVMAVFTEGASRVWALKHARAAIKKPGSTLAEQFKRELACGEATFDLAKHVGVRSVAPRVAPEAALAQRYAKQGLTRAQIVAKVLEDMSGYLPSEDDGAEGAEDSES